MYSRASARVWFRPNYCQAPSERGLQPATTYLSCVAGFHNILASYSEVPLRPRALLLLLALWVWPSGAAPITQRPAEAGPSSRTALLDKYCVTCHSDKGRTGGLSLEKADLVDIPKGAETW